MNVVGGPDLNLVGAGRYWCDGRGRCSERFARDAVGDELSLWLHWIIAALGVMFVSWAMLIALAKRLPAGLLRDLAGFLPACAKTMRRLRRHPSVPRRVRWAVVFALAWVLSPIDLIPEFLPVIGPLDDVVVVALVLRFAARRIPAAVLFNAWPVDPRPLARLIGTPVPEPGES
jgi:Protein of unknown function (DUF1232)